MAKASSIPGSVSSQTVNFFVDNELESAKSNTRMRIISISKLWYWLIRLSIKELLNINEADQNSKIWVVFLYFLVQLLVLLSQLFLITFQQQHHRCGLLCFCCDSQLHSASYVQVWDLILLTQYWNVTNHINGWNICCQYAYALSALPDCLDHILNASSEFFLPIEVPC